MSDEVAEILCRINASQADLLEELQNLANLNIENLLIDLEEISSNQEKIVKAIEEIKSNEKTI